MVGRLLIAPTVTREALVGLCFGALVRQLEFRGTVLYYCYLACNGVEYWQMPDDLIISQEVK